MYPALFHFLRAKPSFIFVRPSTVCNCYTCTRPNAAMAHGFHKFHSSSLFNIEKFCAVSWATMGGQARGEPYHGRCRALGIRPSASVRRAWAPQTGFVIAGMAFRIGGSRSRGWRGARSFPHGPIPIHVRADPVIRDPHPPSRSVHPS